MKELTGARRHLAALEMLAGGASYGFMATTYKLAYAHGYSWQQVVAGQAWMGCLLFALLAVVEAARGTRLVRLPLRDVARLLGLGVLTSVTSCFYCFAMTRLEAPIASGAWQRGIAGLDLVGVGAALVAALSCATFLALSGRVTPECGTGQRGTLICLGMAAVSLVICPTYLPSGVFLTGMAPYALMAGLFGMFLPVLCFGLGGPHLSAASATVLASVELPAGLLVSSVVLGDGSGLSQWVAVAVILGAIAFSQSAGGAKSRAGQAASQEA